MSKFAHQFIKTKGLEQCIAFLMQHTRILWEAIEEKQSFRMVLEYDAEALNVNIDFEETTISPECSPQGNQ